MSNVTISFEVPEPMGKELQLAHVLNSAVHHFTTEAMVPLSPREVQRVVAWLHSKYAVPSEGPQT